MAKLINLQVIEAKNVICVWRNDEKEDWDFHRGIDLDKAEARYMIPRNIVIGTFDNGTVKAAGIFGMGDINDLGEEVDSREEWQGLFLFHQFCYSISLDIAKAFVRGEIEEGEYKDEASAKAGILADMKKAGVTILDEAMEYLSK